jgi:CRP/FNR family transcriptional regulator
MRTANLAHPAQTAMKVNRGSIVVRSPSSSRDLRLRAIAAPGTEQVESIPAGRQIPFAERATIFMEGESADQIYQLVDGTIMLYKLTPDGRRQIVELLRPGDVFGFAPSSVHECSAETLTAGRCVAFKRADLEHSPALLRNLDEHIQAQLCRLHDLAILLGRKTAIERVATFLLRCVPGRGGYSCLAPAPSEERANIRLHMTRHEIADFLGLTIETVSRCLSRLKRRGAITFERPDRIIINDVCRMCRLTGTEAACER